VVSLLVRRAEIGGVCDVAGRQSITDQERMSLLTSWLSTTSIYLTNAVKQVPRFPVSPTYVPSLLGPLTHHRRSHADFNALGAVRAEGYPDPNPLKPSNANVRAV
jgi:hypothetical protein